MSTKPFKFTLYPWDFDMMSLETNLCTAFNFIKFNYLKLFWANTGEDLFRVRLVD